MPTTPNNFNVVQTITVTAIHVDTDYNDKTSVLTVSSLNVSNKTLSVSIKNVDELPETSIPVESVSLNKTTHTLKVGETIQLSETVLPSNATNKTVVWGVSNQNASVTNGFVTAISNGECVISCTTADQNKTAACVLTIEAKENAENDGLVEGAYLLLENVTSPKTIPNDQNIVVDNGDFTLMAKVTNPSFETSKGCYLFGDYELGGKSVYKFEITWQSKTCFNFFGSAYPASSADCLYDSDGSVIVCWVRSGNVIKTYVNNVEGANAGIPDGFVFNEGNEVIKCGSEDRVIEKLAFYKKALTTEELTQNYKSLGGH